MKKHALAVLAYGVSTFVTQALSHFVVNKSHYAGVAYLRPDPIFPLGVAAMLIQGSILSYCMHVSVINGVPSVTPSALDG